jgi:hypothetical protein
VASKLEYVGLPRSDVLRRGTALSNDNLDMLAIDARHTEKAPTRSDACGRHLSLEHPQFRQQRGQAARAACLCTVLLALAFTLMTKEPFVHYHNKATFVIQVHLLLPFLLAVGPLVRSRAWLGVVGAVLFFAASLSMIIENAYLRNGAAGFLFRSLS